MASIKKALFLLFFVAIGAHSAPLTNYQLTISDGVFTPSNLVVDAGKRFKITLENVGKGPAEFENLSLRVEKVLSSGVISFVVVPPLKPGSYHFIDEFHPDAAGLDIIAH